MRWVHSSEEFVVCEALPNEIQPTSLNGDADCNQKLFFSDEAQSSSEIFWLQEK